MSIASKPAAIVSWVAQIATAGILGQTLFYKFAGAPETKAMFDVLGAEPVGRFGTASLELIAVVLLLIPKTAVYGAALALLVICGAIFAHLTKLGISIDPVALGRPELVPIEGPSLFIMAMIVFALSVTVLVIRRRQLPFISAAKG